MEKNPYLVLGVSEDSTKEEITEAYEKLRDRFSKKMLTPGDVGRQAAVKLQKVEEAYQKCMEGFGVPEGAKDFEVYNKISDLIRARELTKAQQLLDDMIDRDAEWHYLQSAVYMNRKWFLESKNHMDKAISLEPNNPKYQNALIAIENMIKAENAVKGLNTAGRAGYKDTDSEIITSRSRTRCSACDICSCLLCADCCCECSGGDLISCC